MPVYVARKEAFAPGKFKVGMTASAPEVAAAKLRRRFGRELGGPEGVRVRVYLPAQGLTAREAERCILTGLRRFRHGGEWFRDDPGARRTLRRLLRLFAQQQQQGLKRRAPEPAGHDDEMADGDYVTRRGRVCRRPVAVYVPDERIEDDSDAETYTSGGTVETRSSDGSDDGTSLQGFVVDSDAEGAEDAEDAEGTEDDEGTASESDDPDESPDEVDSMPSLRSESPDDPDELEGV